MIPLIYCRYCRYIWYTWYIWYYWYILYLWEADISQDNIYFLHSFPWSKRLLQVILNTVHEREGGRNVKSREWKRFWFVDCFQYFLQLRIQPKWQHVLISISRHFLNIYNHHTHAYYTIQYIQYNFSHSKNFKNSGIFQWSSFHQEYNPISSVTFCIILIEHKLIESPRLSMLLSLLQRMPSMLLLMHTKVMLSDVWLVNILLLFSTSAFVAP